MGNGDLEPELQLRLGIGPSSTDGSSNPMRSSRIKEHPHQQQKFTIFYDGRMCVCDVTEMQATAIISMAKQLMEAQIEKSSHNYQRHNDRQQRTQSTSSSSSYPPLVPAASRLINPEPYMKQSLQRFLKKRKTRMDASSI